MNAAFSHRCGVWMLCLGLVLPGVGRAAQVEPTVSPPDAQEETREEAREEAREVPGTQQDAPYRLLEDEQGREEEWREPKGAPRGLRILGEVGGAILTSGALGIVAGLATGFLCSAIRPSQGGFDDLACFAFGFLGFGVGAGLGVPLGVWWAGELLGGDGSLLASLGGTVLGAIGGIVVTVVLGAAITGDGGAGAALVGLSTPVMAVAGGVIGYELTQKVPRGWASRGGLLPVLSVSPHGTVLGLGGHF